MGLIEYSAHFNILQSITRRHRRQPALRIPEGSGQVQRKARRQGVGEAVALTRTCNEKPDPEAYRAEGERPNEKQK